MTMNITSKQMEITPAIRQHVADRLAKLEKWQTHLINPHIILSKEPQGFVADATINTFILSVSPTRLRARFLLTA